MDEAEVRWLALAMPEAVEQPHFERTSFRVRGRIFATLKPGGGANLVLEPDYAAELADRYAGVVTPVTWGSLKGWVRVDLAAAPPGLLEEAIPLAWRRAAPKTLARALDAGS